jgi:hypothetical protein
MREPCEQTASFERTLSSFSWQTIDSMVDGMCGCMEHSTRHQRHACRRQWSAAHPGSLRRCSTPGCASAAACPTSAGIDSYASCSEMDSMSLTICSSRTLLHARVPVRNALRSALGWVCVTLRRRSVWLFSYATVDNCAACAVGRVRWEHTG